MNWPGVPALFVQTGLSQFPTYSTFDLKKIMQNIKYCLKNIVIIYHLISLFFYVPRTYVPLKIILHATGC